MVGCLHLEDLGPDDLGMMSRMRIKSNSIHSLNTLSREFNPLHDTRNFSLVIKLADRRESPGLVRHAHFQNFQTCNEVEEVADRLEGHALSVMQLFSQECR